MTALAPLPVMLTYEEFLALPDDGRRYELIDGVLIMVGGPSISHQLASGELFVPFKQAVMGRGLGWVFAAPTEVKFPGDNTVMPDLVVVLRDRSHVLTENRILGTPTLVLEILSPSNRDYDLTTKLDLYARNRVPEYWVVDLDAETITVFTLRGDAYVAEPLERIARSRIVPGLAVDGPAVFAAARIT